MRPAPNQFRIYWDNNSKKYEPDFIVETQDTIYMVETKAESELLNADVVSKKLAAIEYCTHASEYTKNNGGKMWKYLLIAHTDVSRTSNFSYLVQKAR